MSLEESIPFKKPECIPCVPKPDKVLNTPVNDINEITPPKHAELPIPNPSWLTDCPSSMYELEVIKDGCIIENIKLSGRKSLLIGRLETCDLPLLHPSLSRKHAILLYSGGKSQTVNDGQTEASDNPMALGWYLYDLGSTHGTFVNKARVLPHIFVRVRVGHVLKFAGSTRLFLLQGPEEDQEAEANLTWSEIKQKHEAKKVQLQRAALREDGDMDVDDNSEKAEDTEAASSTCLWGMADDAVEVTDENPFALLDTGLHEETYKEAPQKTLKMYFDREGLEMPAFTFEEAGFGRQQCRFELPLTNAAGGPLFAEVSLSGKRREAIHACALEACRMLDRMGELNKTNGVARPSQQELRQQRLEENEFYSSDEDTFLDRTGIIENKRQQRMKRAGKMEGPVGSASELETFETLTTKLSAIEAEISEIEASLEKARADLAREKKVSELDELEAYMEAIKGGTLDRAARMRFKVRLIELRKEQTRLQRLANIAKPTESAFLKRITAKKPEEKIEVVQLTQENEKQRTIRVRSEKRTFHCKVPEAEYEEEEEEQKEAVEQKKVQKEKSPEKTKTAEKCTVQSDVSIVSESPSTNQEVQPVDRVLGPTMPDNWRELLQVPKETSDGTEESVTTRVRKAPPISQGVRMKKSKVDADEWLPPQDQSGDGSTKLNEKFGY